MGFTLLEVLIVIGILSVISVLGSSIYSSYTKNIEINTTAQVISSDLKQMQSKAMTGDSGLKWGIHFVNNTRNYYELFSTPTDYNDASKIVATTNYLPNGILFSDPTSSSNKDIIFSRITGNTSASSVSITSNGIIQTISVSSVGTVSYGSAYGNIVGSVTYNITAIQSSNGAINPSGVTKVASGGNQSYNIVPNSGYQIATITVDGSFAAPTSPVTFSSVTRNHTITATFSSAAPIITTPTSSSITATTATLGANITSLGTPASLSSLGVCYGISPNPSVNCTTVAASPAISVSAWGGGGGGMGQDNNNGSGAGGAYSNATILVSSNTTAYVNVGSGGVGGQYSSTSGSASWFNKAGNNAPTSNTDGVKADGGLGAPYSYPNNSSQLSNSIGTTINIGGAGGTGQDPGAGSSGSPSGAGGNGAISTTGGAGGSSVGAGNGGAAGGSSYNGGDGESNSLGGGGGGGAYNNRGGNGGFPGGGGGGGYTTNSIINPGIRGTNTNSHGYGGDGASGVVVISYPTGGITATGGTITTSGGNTYHTFTSSGIFSVTSVLSLTSGVFTQSVTGLSANTLYYYRGYAVNASGTGYSPDGVFTTSPASAPTVTTTDPVTGISAASAIGGGTVSSNGGATVSVSGLVWGTSINPTTANNKTVDGWAIGGPWTSNMTGLTAGTLYHVRAYATNVSGTSYGLDVTFTTSPSCSGTTFNGYCWYKQTVNNPNPTCNDTCASVGSTCVPNTQTGNDDYTLYGVMGISRNTDFSATGDHAPEFNDSGQYYKREDFGGVFTDSLVRNNCSYSRNYWYHLCSCAN